MKYKVHRLDVKSNTMQENLEKHLNSIRGEVVSIIPNVNPTFQLMGATSKVNFLLIVEKVIQLILNVKAENKINLLCF